MVRSAAHLAARFYHTALVHTHDTTPPTVLVYLSHTDSLSECLAAAHPTHISRQHVHITAIMRAAAWWRAEGLRHKTGTLVPMLYTRYILLVRLVSLTPLEPQSRFGDKLLEI